MTAPRHALKSIALAAGLVAVAGCAQPPAPTTTSAALGGGQCFFQHQVTAVQPVSKTQLNVRVSHRDVYRIDMSAPCHTLTLPQRVINLEPRGASTMCSAADTDVTVITNGFPERCMISNIRHLSADEVASLPGRERP